MNDQDDKPHLICYMAAFPVVIVLLPFVVFWNAMKVADAIHEYLKKDGAR